MAGTLSERFSKLKATGAATKAKTNRSTARKVTQSSARQAQADARRRGSNASGAKPAAKGGKKGVQIKKVAVNGKGRKGKAGAKKGGKKGGNKPAADKTPSSSMDLDKAMDTYWFKGGKGQDPNLVALDNDMDNYFKNKAAAEEPAATA